MTDYQASYDQQQAERVFPCACDKCKCTEKSESENKPCLLCRLNSHEDA